MWPEGKSTADQLQCNCYVGWRDRGAIPNSDWHDPGADGGGMASKTGSQNTTWLFDKNSKVVKVQDKREALRRSGKLYNSDSCWAALLLHIGRIAIDYGMFLILYKNIMLH